MLGAGGACTDPYHSWLSDSVTTLIVAAATMIAGRLLRCPSAPDLGLYTRRSTSPGTTGFDVVVSWGWLRVEVPGGLVKPPENNKCGHAQL